MGDLKNYTNFVKTYKKSIKIFIGKDINNKYFNGNSILLKIKINTYVFIQYSIIKFTTPNNDEIIKFISLLLEEIIFHIHLDLEEEMYILFRRNILYFK